ncbi:MAG: hypothetical protein IKK24_06850, partial [Clostridia bacterium]|nr:hypothetical protein [Clostridia bacterium]
QSFFSQMGTLDNQPLENMYPTFDATYKAMENYGSGSLSENIHQYMLDIGVTAEEIASIKNIMLEEVK